MKSRLHKVFLITAAIAYAILWIGSNFGPFTELIRDSLILEGLVAALVFDLLWQLIAREDAVAESQRTDAMVKAELERQGTLLLSLLPLLDLKSSGSTYNIPPLVRNLVASSAAELTDVATKGRIRIRGRRATIQEALNVISDSESKTFTKNHIPPLVWKEDPAGRNVTEYLEQQQKAAESNGLIRIHVYDQAAIRAYSNEEWEALEWLAAQHTGSLEFRVCSADWDRRSSTFEGKGLVLGTPGGVDTLLLFEQPYIGTSEGVLVWEQAEVDEARHHLEMLMQHSESFEDFISRQRQSHG